jgi:hypothetical protein
VFADGAIRLCSPIGGGCFFDGTSLNDNNTVTVKLQKTSFADNFLFDVAAAGVFSDDLGNDGDPVMMCGVTRTVRAEDSRLS